MKRTVNSDAANNGSFPRNNQLDTWSVVMAKLLGLRKFFEVCYYQATAELLLVNYHPTSRLEDLESTVSDDPTWHSWGAFFIIVMDPVHDPFEKLHESRGT